MAIEIENELTFNDYLSVLKRRWLLILLTFLITMIIIVITAYTLPIVYSSEGVISIESPSISKEVIGQNSDQPPVTKYVDERIDKVKQKILSRENLVSLNEKYELYPGLVKPADIAGAFLKNIKIASEQKAATADPWSSKVTVGLVVGFEYSDPEKAYKVANDLVTQLLDENTKDRTMRASETTSFLTEELNRLKAELEAMDNKVAEYKKKHANSLPEHQEMHMAMLDQLRTSLKDLDRDYKTTQEELRYLDVELTTTDATLSNTDIDGNVTTVSDLDKAKAELERSLVLYKDTHPTVKALKRKVTLLENTEKAPKETAPKKTNVIAELAIAKIKTQIEAAKARLVSVSDQKKSVLAQMSNLQSQIIKIPEVERGLITLTRDYENAKEKYEDVKAKQINAKIAENLELENKTERFILKHSPEFPQYRKSPVRKKIIGLGFLAAIIISLAVAALLEFLDKRVRGQGALISITGMKPIVVVPYIYTKAELLQKQNLSRHAIILTITIISLLLIVAIIHFFVMPLNSLLTGLL